MDRGASLKGLAAQLRLQKRVPDAEPFLDLMSDGFVWSDERLHGLSVEEMGGLRAIFRFRTSLITGLADSRFENLWNELRKICPEWIGFDVSRCSPNETLAARYRSSKRKPHLASLDRLRRKLPSVSLTEAKHQSVATVLLLRARRALQIQGEELDLLDLEFYGYLEEDQLESALKTIEKIAEVVPCRGGFWRDLERAAITMGLNDRAKYFRGRLLSTKPRAWRMRPDLRPLQPKMRLTE
jgi:hypothetical protein